MGDKNLEQAVHIARRFIEQRFPEALLVLLCGSWARGCAHQDSDIDLFVIDAKMSHILFEGLIFESWLIEVCALSPQRVETFFAASARHRSAPVPHQVLDGVRIFGEASYAEQIKNTAQRILSAGPQALNKAEKLDLRWHLTALLNDLAHGTADEIPALAAQCHTQLAQAAIDAVQGWRGERKTLRSALAEAVPKLVDRLDEGLVAACRGERQPLLDIGHQIVNELGGYQRTYFERY